MKFIQRADRYIEHHNLGFAKHVGLFMMILFGFHFLYSSLIDDTLMIPGLEGMYLLLRQGLFTQSAWVVEHILRYDIVRQGDAMIFASGGTIIVNESCSAVKWFAHFLVLMLLFPGPWKHKAWFIPAGLVVTHLVNIIRVSGLAVVYVIKPLAFDFAHDYVFRPFFYLVLFLMWVVWVEFFFLPLKNTPGKTNI